MAGGRRTVLKLGSLFEVVGEPEKGRANRLELEDMSLLDIVRSRGSPGKGPAPCHTFLISC